MDSLTTGVLAVLVVYIKRAVRSDGMVEKTHMWDSDHRTIPHSDLHRIRTRAHVCKLAFNLKKPHWRIKGEAMEIRYGQVWPKYEADGGYDSGPLKLRGINVELFFSDGRSKVHLYEGAETCEEILCKLAGNEWVAYSVLLDKEFNRVYNMNYYRYFIRRIKEAR